MRGSVCCKATLLWPVLLGLLFLSACCCVPPKVAEPAPAATPSVPPAPKPIAPPSGATLGMGPIVDAAWIAPRLEDPAVRILDNRGDAFAYEAGHIPGAVFLDKAAVGKLLDEPPGLPANAGAMVEILRAAGVNDGSTVVVYDATTSPWAARVFWALQYLGHDDVRVMDGGLAKWTCETLPVETEKVTPARGDFTARVREDRLATKEWILAHLGDPGVILLDVRTPAEYAGEDVMAQFGGHIPGAINLEWTRFLAADGSGVLLTMPEIREILTSAGITPDREVVTYCQVGGRAAHTYLVLKLVGFERVRLYEGSWAEWGNDPTLPIETTP